MIGKFKDVRSKKLKREGFVTKPIFICGPHTCHIYRWITNPSLYSEPSKTLTNSAVLVCCTMYFGRRLLKFDLYAYYENKHISSHHIGLELTLQSSQMLVGQVSAWIRGLYSCIIINEKNGNGTFIRACENYCSCHLWWTSHKYRSWIQSSSYQKSLSIFLQQTVFPPDFPCASIIISLAYCGILSYNMYTEFLNH